MNDLDAAKQSLIDAGRVLEFLGQGDMTRGHVSVRVPGSEAHFLMKPHSVGLDEITPDNIVTFDLEGDLVAGTARPHSERYIHSEIYRVRPDIHAVIHSHPTHAVAFSNTGQKMLALSQGGAIFKDALGMFTDAIDLIRDKRAGAAVAKALGPHHAVLMRSHGIALGAGSLAAAVVLAVGLEEACRIQLLSTASGHDGWEYPEADVAALRHKLTRPDQFEVNFNYLVRRMRRASPATC